MTVIPSNLARAPNALVSRIASGSIGRTQLGLLNVSNQMSTGRLINAFSDDGVKAAAILTLSDSIARREQQKRNLDHADASLNALDQALGDGNELLLEARRIASEQVNVGSSPQERQGQAVVVNQMIQGLYQLASRKSVAGYIFGGNTPGTQPVQPLFGGYRFLGQGSGLITDIDLGSSVPITLGQPNPIGETSVRVKGTADLNPGIVGGTRLVELNGARGAGVKTGKVEFSFAGGPRTQIDLSQADTVEQVATTIANALKDYERTNSVTILGPRGVTWSGGSLRIDVDNAGAAPDPTLTFFDMPGGSTGVDLGLVNESTPFSFSATTPDGVDVQAKLSWRTPVAALRGITGALGSIKISSLGQSRIIDLSQAQNLGDIRNAIEGTGLGLRVEINADGSGIDVVNEVSAGRAEALSIEEVPTGNAATDRTAERLGIRSMMGSTRLSDFNDGRGVQIVDGATNPITGQLDPAKNSDLRITLGDGRIFDVDLRPQDVVTVQSLINRINAAAADPANLVGPANAAPIQVPGEFVATLGNGANGIELVQPGNPNRIKVEPRNNSPAAEQLGFLDGTYDPATGTFRAVDRAKVRVDNLFTALIDLRDALQNNDTNGITLAGERVESIVDRVSQTRALVGGFSRRVLEGQQTQEDLLILDQSTRSQLQDLDFTEASIRLNQLQVQLQAGYSVTSQILSRSLLDFLG